MCSFSLNNSCLCVCVCVCVRERDRQTDRQTQADFQLLTGGFSFYPGLSPNSLPLLPVACFLSLSHHTPTQDLEPGPNVTSLRPPELQLTLFILSLVISWCLAFCDVRSSLGFWFDEGLVLLYLGLL